MPRSVNFVVEVVGDGISEFLSECSKVASTLNDAGFTILAVHGIDNKQEKQENNKDEHSKLLDDLDDHAISNFGDEVTPKTIDRLLDFAERHRYDPDSPEGVLERIRKKHDDEGFNDDDDVLVPPFV